MTEKPASIKKHAGGKGVGNKQELCSIVIDYHLSAADFYSLPSNFGLIGV